MTLFQTLAMWSLRAIVLWGAAEASLSLYEQSAAQLSAWHQVSGHRAAMQRLDQRAEAAERDGAEARAALSGPDRPVWRLPPGTEGVTPAAQAANLVRTEMFAHGAQAPVVDGAAASESDALARVTLQATWRELEAASPSAFAYLASRAPQLEVVSLKMTRLSGAGLVDVEAEFVASVQPTHEAGP
jgi:hypothetical protein